MSVSVAPLKIRKRQTEQCKFEKNNEFVTDM